jgi:hypothetical protein
MNLPLQIYDFISILFPGVIALVIVKIEFPSLLIWSVEKQNTQLVILFVMSYITGHLIQGISRLSTIKKLMYLLTFRKMPESQTRNITNLRGRHYSLPFSNALEGEIKKSITEFYKLDVDSLKREEVFNLVFSPVHDRMNNRDIFVAIANLHRAMGVLTSISLIYYLFKSIYLIFSKEYTLEWGKTLWLLLLLIIANIVFVNGIDYFKKFSDSIPFYSFLAWYKEKRLTKEEKSDS